MFAVKITAPAISGKWYAIFQRIFDKKLKQAERRIIERLQYDVKERHRYKHKTYNLRNSTTVKGSLLSKKGVLVEVNLGKARYATYIIGGTRHWAPDPFIEDAMKRNESFINEQLEWAGQQAAVEFNRVR